MAFISRVARYIRRHCAGYTLHRAGEMLCERVLHTYDHACRKTDPDEDTLSFQRTHQPGAGIISVAIPAFNTRPAFLAALADSLSAQT